MAELRLDFLAALTWSEYEHGIDPALEEIRKMILAERQ
jgi:hypothetical protein